MSLKPSAPVNTMPLQEVGVGDLKGRILCAIGRHLYRRSKFVALNCRVANLVCQRCGKQVETD